MSHYSTFTCQIVRYAHELRKDKDELTFLILVSFKRLGLQSPSSPDLHAHGHHGYQCGGGSRSVAFGLAKAEAPGNLAE